MTKEEMLKAYLKDDFFKEKGVFKDDSEVDKINWSDFGINENDPLHYQLITVVQIAIEGVKDDNKTDDQVKRKINKFLNE